MIICAKENVCAVRKYFHAWKCHLNDSWTLGPSKAGHSIAPLWTYNVETQCHFSCKNMQTLFHGLSWQIHWKYPKT